MKALWSTLITYFAHWIAVMDATSLGFSAFSLAIQLFNVASDGYSNLTRTRPPNTQDSDVVGLQVQQCRFVSWAEATGLSDEQSLQFNEPFLLQTLLKALSDTVQLLQDAFHPDSAYGLVVESTRLPLTASLRQNGTPSTRLAVSRNQSSLAMPMTPIVERIQAQLASAQASFSAFQHAHWKISNPQLFKCLVDRLREKIDNLESLFPRPIQISAVALCEANMLQSDSPSHLKLIAEATSDSLPSLSQSADFKSNFIDANLNRDMVNQAKYIHQTHLIEDKLTGGSRALATYEGSGLAPVRVLVEWKRTGVLKHTVSVEESERITKDRIKRMVVILGKPTDASFRSLLCLGYSTSIDGRTGLVFKLPDEAAKAHPPLSLMDLLNRLQTRKSKKPPLEDRLRLCHALALSIYRLHRIGVVHKHITPANIIFFPHKNTAITSIREPFLTGFDFAREEVTIHQSENPMEQIEGEELYRHHSWKVGRPSTKAVDIYALGVLLIEICFWTSIKNAKKRADEQGFADFCGFLLTEFVDSEVLAYRMGTEFQNAVRHCLQVDFEGDKEDTSSMLGSFFGIVVQGLASFSFK